MLEYFQLFLLPYKSGFSVCSEEEPTPSRSDSEGDELLETLLEKDQNKAMREKKSPNSYKNRKKKVNRGNKKGKETELCMMSANAAQLKGKLNSFKGELKSSNAAIFTVQETHYATKGKIQIPNFEILK